MVSEHNNHNDDQPMAADGLHPDAPRHKSPVKWMALVMLSLVVVTTYSLWDKEKISVKSTVTVPPLSDQGQRGREVFATACAQCHGADGSGGSRTGPPLIHPMYRTSVFPDFVFKKRHQQWKTRKKLAFWRDARNHEFKPATGRRCHGLLARRANRQRCQLMLIS
ncbi:MAG: cytochrome c [Magnetovibrio sp.]|nr:cytochrome c [Magnetovibrio sp.]